jgi:hypothetical protein
MLALISAALDSEKYLANQNGATSEQITPKKSITIAWSILVIYPINPPTGVKIPAQEQLCIL